ncbi:hypothetical protein GGI35DRAFT_66678 [Trichoderma velutinum]
MAHAHMVDLICSSNSYFYEQTRVFVPNNKKKIMDASKDLPPFPYPYSDWAHDDPSHSGFHFHGLDTNEGNKAYFIHLEAKEGKEDLVAQFLRDIHNGVNKEPGTRPWFALRYSKSTFLIFEAFPDSEARRAHNIRPGGQNFRRVELLKDMLAYPANLYRLDVLHGKFGVMLGKEVKPTS